MSAQLITVYINDASNGNVLSLDLDSKLVKTRVNLESDKLMKPTDSFLMDGNPLKREDENIVTLSQLIGDSKKLYVGNAGLGPVSPDRSIAAWNNLSTQQKQALFENIEIYRGIALTGSKGFAKSYNNIVSWKDLDKISTKSPRIITEVSSDYTFSSITKEMKTFGIEKTSVTFTSPWASANAEYETEKSKSTSSKKVSTYLIGKYIVRKVAIDVKPSNLIVSDDFLNAVKDAVRDHKDTVDGYANLIAVLDEYGYYVPGTFTLGGILYSTTSTQIDDFSQAESEKESFSGGFNAAFKGIGGGAAYSNATGSEQSTSTSSKYENQTLQQIGGVTGTSNDYNKWVTGLDPAINWNVASYESLIPSIGLIGLASGGLGRTCTNLLSTFYTYQSVKDKQNIIDMGDYSKKSLDYFKNPF